MSESSPSSESQNDRLSPELANELISMIESVEKEEADKASATEDGQSLEE